MQPLRLAIGAGERIDAAGEVLPLARRYLDIRPQRLERRDRIGLGALELVLQLGALRLPTGGPGLPCGNRGFVVALAGGAGGPQLVDLLGEGAALGFENAQ